LVSYSNLIAFFYPDFFWGIFIKIGKTISAIKNEILKSHYRFPDHSSQRVLNDLLFISGAFSIFDFQVEEKNLV